MFVVHFVYCRYISVQLPVHWF